MPTTPEQPDRAHEPAPFGGPSRLASMRERHGEKLRFLVVGGWNTLLGYAVLWVLDRLLGAHLRYELIMTIGWVIGVTHNLFTFKLLVFRTKGRWLREYLRSYVVYAGSFVLNVLIVKLLLDVLGVSGFTIPIGEEGIEVRRLLVAQAPALVVVTIVSYFGHKLFTYGRPPGEA